MSDQSQMLVSLQPKFRVHVYRACMSFKDKKEGCIFICDCNRMEQAWPLLDGLETSESTIQDVWRSLNPCLHASAISDLHEQQILPYGSMLETAISSFRDISFSSLAQPITFIQNSGSSLIFSFKYSDGHPCDNNFWTLIRTNTNRHYTCCRCSVSHHCEHIKLLSDWLIAHSEDDTAADVFESFSFKGSSHQHDYDAHDGEGASPSSISSLRIPLDFWNSAMHRRAGLFHPSTSDPYLVPLSGLLPLCPNCTATSAAHCYHCVPAVPELGACTCGSSWDERDPVAMGWMLQRDAVLTNIFGSVKVSEAFEKFLRKKS